MRNRKASLLGLTAAALLAAAAAADDREPANEAGETETFDDGLAPIDLTGIAPIRADLESVDATALISPIVCARVRTIRSWIPREVCVTREQLAEWEENRSERVAHDIRTLREIQRFQSRNGRGGWRSRRY